eukprot:764634-Hanusia_phi.AAC.5
MFIAISAIDQATGDVTYLGQDIDINSIHTVTGCLSAVMLGLLAVRFLGKDMEEQMRDADLLHQRADALIDEIEARSRPRPPLLRLVLLPRAGGGVSFVLVGHGGGEAGQGGVVVGHGGGEGGGHRGCGELGDEEALHGVGLLVEAQEDGELRLEVGVVHVVVAAHAGGHHVGDLLDVELRVLEVRHHGVDVVDLLVEAEGLHGGGGLLDGGDEGLVYLRAVEDVEVVLEGLALADDLRELHALLLGLDEEGLERLDAGGALGLDLVRDGGELVAEGVLLRAQVVDADDEAVDGLGGDGILVLVEPRAAQGADPGGCYELHAGGHGLLFFWVSLCGAGGGGGIYKSAAGVGRNRHGERCGHRVQGAAQPLASVRDCGGAAR